MKIDFNEQDHSYEVDGKKVISVTQLLKKHGISPDYEGVNEDILQAASERGTLIHKEIEDYITEGKIGFTSELQDFIRLCEENDLKPVSAEVRTANDLVAGTIDILAMHGTKVVLIDTKTTAVLHKEAVRWQTSIYADLFTNIDELGVMHLGKNSKFLWLDWIPREELDRLYECERRGIPYETHLDVSKAELDQIVAFETVVANLTEEKKRAEQQLNELKTRLYERMLASNVVAFENDILKITRVAPTVKKILDGDRLKADHPELIKDYYKDSATKGYVRIKCK